MNFDKSSLILNEIDKANKILLAFHHSVDPDSITSNLLMARYLEKKGKEVKLVYSGELPIQFKESYDLSKVTEKVDMMNFKFSDYDLFITLDINDPKRIELLPDFKIDTKVINIDHHLDKGVNSFEYLKINDPSYSSTSEMIYYLLEDFGYEMDEVDANLILLGILTDTESFSYGASPRVFHTVSKLLELGANYDNASLIMDRNNSLDQIKFWSFGLSKLEVDKENKFAYIAMNIDEVNKFKNILQGPRTLADKFVRTIKNTNFGLIMTETKEGNLKISVRSRIKGFGVMELLKAFGGGGHFDGGGGQIDGLPYNDAVEKVLEITRGFAKSRLEDVK